MDDLIKRQDAVNELSYCQTYLFDSRDNDKKISLEDAEYTIERLPSAQQWIPCSERLPEKYVNVLCYQPILYGSNMWIGYLNREMVWVDSDGWEKLTNPVTAWMPLPEPYKEETES